jgi:hypothetical protein
MLLWVARTRDSILLWGSFLQDLDSLQRQLHLPQRDRPAPPCDFDHITSLNLPQLDPGHTGAELFYLAFREGSANGYEALTSGKSSKRRHSLFKSIKEASSLSTPSLEVMTRADNRLSIPRKSAGHERGLNAQRGVADIRRRQITDATRATTRASQSNLHLVLRCHHDECLRLQYRGAACDHQGGFGCGGNDG